MLRVKACGLSDVGMTRVHNEDCFALESAHQLFVVADGMGGHSHGEIASRIAVDTIRDFVIGGNGQSSPPTADEARLRPHSHVLASAIRLAHGKVLAAIGRDSRLQGMGTTVAGVLVDGSVAAVAHVGDSRVYRARGGKLELLTQDHTWVNEQVVAGFLSEEQARVHPLKNVVTRALGGESEVEVDVREVQLAPGDVYLLCSDGLTTMLSDPEIERHLLVRRPLEETCQKLVQEANGHGGVDNITIVLVQVDEA